MALQYKNQGFILNTTNLTTVITIAADSRALVKSISVTNEHSSDNLVEMYLTDSSAATDYRSTALKLQDLRSIVDKDDN
jgi:hypothetical protein